MRRWWSRRRRAGVDDAMTCAEVARVLQRFLDGQLDEHRAKRAALHLDRCRDCGLEADTYMAIKQSLFALGTPSPHALARLHDFAEGLAQGDAPVSGSPSEP